MNALKKETSSKKDLGVVQQLVNNRSKAALSKGGSIKNVRGNKEN